MISAVLMLLGIALLIAGGALLVRGASEVAADLGVSPLVVGLTVVGFGTSAPELVVNVVGAVRGATGLAFGNVVGSNISNLGLVLGIAAIMTPITIQGQVVRREVPLLLLATLVITVMALDLPLDGRAAMISRSEAVVLMLLFGIFLYVNALDIVQRRRPDPLIVNIEGKPRAESVGRYRWLLIVAGIVILSVGGEMTVRSGMAVANAFGVSPAIVGLVAIAVGTSMPELVTSIIAAVRGESDLALGNVVGSNIFNSLIVLPATGLISQIPVPRGGTSDLVMSLLLAALLIPVFFFGEARMGRKTGILLAIAYVSYVTVRVIYD
ncbi:MAG: calcium/sodium antiporter [Gammaproteobacteria bacterium]|nr:calcium/sodium antiporter [Gammaproteobacteria bacterium]